MANRLALNPRLRVYRNCTSVKKEGPYDPRELDRITVTGSWETPGVSYNDRDEPPSTSSTSASSESSQLAMADPISFLPTVLALGKTLVTIVKYLTSLRGSLRKAERHLNDAVNFQTIIDQSLQQFGRFAPWTVSEDQRVVSQLKRSHQICQAYTDLLIDIKESRLVSIKWKLKEQGVEEQAQRLERSKTSLILAISLAKSVGDL